MTIKKKAHKFCTISCIIILKEESQFVNSHNGSSYFPSFGCISRSITQNKSIQSNFCNRLLFLFRFSLLSFKWRWVIGWNIEYNNQSMIDCTIYSNTSSKVLTEHKIYRWISNYKWWYNDWAVSVVRLGEI